MTAQLLKGFRQFHEDYYKNNPDLYQSLASVGQKPEFLFITCCDSRVDPTAQFQSPPGRLFVVRNIAGVVPPYFDGCQAAISVGAAIQFSLNALAIKNIIIMGHSQCAGVGILRHDCNDISHLSSVSEWMQQHNVESHHCTQQLELKSIVQSYENLKQYPYLKDKSDITIHTWYFQIETGYLFSFDGVNRFNAVSPNTDRSILLDDILMRSKNVSS